MAAANIDWQKLWSKTVSSGGHKAIEKTQSGGRETENKIQSAVREIEVNDIETIEKKQDAVTTVNVNTVNVSNTGPDMHIDDESASPNQTTPLVLAPRIHDPISLRLITIWEQQQHPEFIIAGATTILGLLFTLLLWRCLRRNKRRASEKEASTAPVPVPEVADAESVQRALNERISTIEEQVQKSLTHKTDTIDDQRALKERIRSVEEQAQKSLSQKIEAIDDHVRKTIRAVEEQAQKSLNQKTEAIDETVRKAINRVHRALSQRLDALEAVGERIDALEDGVRELDSKQLDLEAFRIMQRAFHQRLETAEETVHVLDNKARATAQRIESLDDSVRVIDSRSKSLSQRVEVIEDTFTNIDGQVTLLGHDVSRGGLALEKVQRQVKMLPDEGRLRALSRAWEARFKKLDGKMDEYKRMLDEESARREQERLRQEEEVASLSFSYIESVDIKPSGPIYTCELSPTFFDASALPLPPTPEPTPSPSMRSYSMSTCSSYSSSSTILSNPITPAKRSIDTAGFRETTFSVRQKMSQPNLRQHNQQMERTDRASFSRPLATPPASLKGSFTK